MADRYAAGIGLDANPGTIIAPKRNLDTPNGLLSLPHGESDTSQPSALYLSRGDTPHWLQQRLWPNAGSLSSILTIDEFGAGSQRPAIDWENVDIGAYAGVFRAATSISETYASRALAPAWARTRLGSVAGRSAPRGKTARRRPAAIG
jgi:hypothetical protein